MTGQQNCILLVVILLLAIGAGFVSFNKKMRTYFGLDIRGGVRVTLRPKIEEWTKKGRPWTSGNLEAVRQVIENRVNIQGVSEPLIITKPESNQIVVELPGLKDEKEALDRLQSTASLQFYLLRQLGTKNQPRHLESVAGQREQRYPCQFAGRACHHGSRTAGAGL